MSMRRGGVEVIILPPIPPPQTEPERELLVQQIDQFGRDLWMIRFAIVSVALALVIAFGLLLPAIIQVIPLQPGPNSPPPPPVTSPPTPIPTLPPPTRAPQPAIQQPAPSRALPTLPTWIVIAVIVVGVALVAANYIAHRRFLSRRDDRETPPNLDGVSASNMPATKGVPSVHRDIVARMRHREVFEDETLDIAATLEATCANAGRFTSIFERRSRLPEYLILIERTSPEDVRAVRARRSSVN
jgi:hypothetical protein